uniref:Tail fiber protein, putative n=2 Tax=Nitratidesulfovibrio TaxID=2802295 RepID=B8DLJ2_NITV9
MSDELKGIWTAKGLEKLAAAYAGGAPLVLRQIAVGDGGGSVPAPAPSWTGLAAEKWRGNVNAVMVNPDAPTEVVADVVLPFNVGGFFIREWGLFDEAGDMVAVGPHAETYKPLIAEGTAVEVTERIRLPLTNSAAVTLTIASAAMATQQYVRQYVTQVVEGHEASEAAHPQATTEVVGFVRRATDEKAAEGVDTEDYVTPKQLADALKRVGGMPIGMTFWWPGTTPPAGSLAINDGPLLPREAYPQLWAMAQASGNIITEAAWQAQAAVQSSVGAFSSGDGATTFRCPRLRDFVRGANPSGGRAVGAWQAHATEGLFVPMDGDGETVIGVVPSWGPATHDLTSGPGTVNVTASTSGILTIPTGTGETLPRTVNWLPCIKAFDHVTNAGEVDIAALVATLAGKVDRSDWSQHLGPSGWQRLPSGLIIQWGVTAVLARDTTTIITFPVAFPTACCQMYAATKDTAYGVDAASAHCSAISLSQASISYDGATAASAPARAVAWLAIGY